eukprot:TRINITY_DN10399_c0_g1_i2.p1 TRINITY_DN10399_c0_g1~~TRINITY_DN10399_c0_g1_i2.p1  ORF type:complete len:173 (+),score=31.82 TRINITY_DN10399_c0_g1_i2:242-760(+)
MADCERQPVRKVGMIMKQGSFVKNWKLRWLELRVSCMQYFQCQPPAPAKLKGTVHLTSDCKVIGPAEVSRAVAWPKKLYGPANSINCCFALETKGRTYYFVAPTSDECKEWVEHLNKALTGPRPRPESIFATAEGYSRRASMATCEDQVQALQCLIEDDETGDIGIEDDDSF